MEVLFAEILPERAAFSIDIMRVVREICGFPSHVPSKFTSQVLVRQGLGPGQLSGAPWDPTLKVRGFYSSQRKRQGCDVKFCQLGAGGAFKLFREVCSYLRFLSKKYMLRRDARATRASHMFSGQLFVY